MDTSNQFFQTLKSKRKVSDKQLKYLTYEYKKVSNLGKIYLLQFTMIHNDPGRLVISKCGTPTKKASEILDYRLKLIMQREKSYIKGSGDFINKMKNLPNLLEGAILVTADVVGLYPSILYEAGLHVVREALDNKGNKHIPTDNLLKMAEFVSENNYFEFNGKVKETVVRYSHWNHVCTNVYQYF